MICVGGARRSYGLAERGVLGDVERHAVGELDAVGLVGAGLVERDERAAQRLLVLGADGDGEAVDDGGEDLQQLRDAVVLLVLVEELVEDVVDRLADGDAAVGQLAVDAVRHRLQTLALALVHRVEQRDQVAQKGVVDESLAQVVVDLRGKHQVDQQLVYQRDVRPLGVRKHLVVVVVAATARVHQTAQVRQRTEQVYADHVQRVLQAAHVVEERAVRQRANAPSPHRLGGVHQLQQGAPLHLARSLLAVVLEVEANAADEELLPEKGTALRNRGLFA